MNGLFVTFEPALATFARKYLAIQVHIFCIRDCKQRHSAVSLAPLKSVVASEPLGPVFPKQFV